MISIIHNVARVIFGLNKVIEAHTVALKGAFNGKTPIIINHLQWECYTSHVNTLENLRLKQNRFTAWLTGMDELITAAKKEKQEAQIAAQTAYQSSSAARLRQELIELPKSAILKNIKQLRPNSAVLENKKSFSASAPRRDFFRIPHNFGTFGVNNQIDATPPIHSGERGTYANLTAVQKACERRIKAESVNLEKYSVSNYYFSDPFGGFAFVDNQGHYDNNIRPLWQRASDAVDGASSVIGHVKYGLDWLRNSAPWVAINKKGKPEWRVDDKRSQQEAVFHYRRGM